MNVTTKMESITPRMAQQFTQTIDPNHQRKLSDSHCDALAREMASGFWKISHQGIAFDELGRLIDGQHRMHAVIRSGATIPMMVTRGLPVKQSNGVEINTFDVFDSGKPRSIGTKLCINGYSNGNRIAAACLAIQHIACNSTTAKASFPAAKMILKLYGKDVLPYEKQATNLQGLRSGHVIGSMALCRHAFTNKIDLFFNQVMSGENLKKGMPAYALRSYLLGGSFIAAGVRNSAVKDRLVNAVALAAMHFVLKNELNIIKSSSMGLDFFVPKQKADLRKIREACGVTE